MNELLAIALERLAEHYQVSSDRLRRTLLIRGVAELSAATDRSKPATPEDLERTLAAMNTQLGEIIHKFRKQAAEIDDTLQHANIALAVIDRVTAGLAPDTKKTPTDTQPL